ncbi:MAG: hypothetical protein OEM41_06200, partial [Ignavibacteria bacterium]|nr:hypothetical protein [Ignavibacteria bacterium]
WMFPCIGTYLHGQDKMSAETKAAVRNAWKTYEPYRGDTENHWAMYYTSLYLATEAWPDLPGTEWYNGMSSDENRRDAREYLIEWMRISTTIGQGEFDSPDYLPEYVISMSLLETFARDPEMKKRGTMMMDYLLADFAAEHLAGQYLGGFSRIYQPSVYKPLNSPASGFAYLYFGTGEPTLSGWIVLPALGSYRPPDIIHRIAIDRSKPYVHKERKRVRNVIRFGKEKNPPVYKYTYVTADYGIGSLQGGILQPIQQHTWGVRYLHGKPYTTIFGLHPYWSLTELGMFFPEEIKPLIADVVASKGTYNNPDKWTGGSPFERTFQHKNTLIALYDIEPGTTTEHIDGFFPRNLEERITDPSGWILCKAGHTYIGWYPLQPYEWIEEEDPSLKEPDTTTVTGHWRLRSHRLQNGYVVEVRSQREIGSFEAFANAARARVPKAQLQPGGVSVDYTTLEGDKMTFTFPDTRSLNGKEIDLTKYKLFDGPFLQADVGSQKLTIVYKDRKRILDFTSLSITE